MNDAELEQATRELNAAVDEVVRYMNNRSDFFTVNVGAFEIRFNLADLGKPREDGGAKAGADAAADNGPELAV